MLLDTFVVIASLAVLGCAGHQAVVVQALPMALIACPVWPLTIAINRGYDRANIGIGSGEIRAVFRAAVVVTAGGAVMSATLSSYTVAAMVVLAIPPVVLGSLAARFGTRKHLHREQQAGRRLRRLIVVGSARAAANLSSLLDREPHCGMRVIGACVPPMDVATANAAGLHTLGDWNDVPKLTGDHRADAVAITGGLEAQHNFLRELAWKLEDTGVELLVHPGLVEVAGPRIHVRPLVGLPLIHVEQPCFTGWRRFIKRVTDIVLASFILVGIAPLLAVIALAIKFSDGGPVIFRQTRVGVGGRPFVMFKFRSMHVDAEERLAEVRAANPNVGLMFKLIDDPRVTKVGKFIRRFSLDELPQLFNVLTGSMSLVGPRPPLPSEVDAYEDHARRRLLVTPGLTGLWQVSGRSLLNWEETVRLDLRYVENWTLALDMLILWKTFAAVLAKRGAF